MAQQRTIKKLGITWCDETVNPLNGCTRVSPGCQNCWASDTSHSLLLKGQTKHLGLTDIDSRGHYAWNGSLNWSAEQLANLSKLTGKRIFLNSMSDTFHESVKPEWTDEMFKAMRDNPQNIYQLLTKRADRMLAQMRFIDPMPHVWLGFSAENQQYFDGRWDYVKYLAKQGWTTWASVEPQIGHVVLGDAAENISWVVIGGDNTKPHTHAREFDIAWAESLIAECRKAKVPVFMKQLGVRPYWTVNGKAYAYTESTGEGKYMVEWPESIRFQQFPAIVQSMEVIQ